MNKNNFKVGIIIPAYNVENYITRGIDSCINQTYANIEIIIVDDGSSDDTFYIASKYKSIDSRVKVYKQQNKGVSSARNLGLDMCSSDYVIFLDSDDWLEVDTIDKLLDNLRYPYNNCLVSSDAYFAFIKDGQIKKYRAPNISDYSVIKSEDALYFLSKPKFKLRSSCYKLYSMTIIDEFSIRFNESVSHGEDGLFVFEYLKNVDDFIYFPELLWNILDRPGSATNVSYNRKMLTAIKAVDYMLEYNNSESLDIVIRNYRNQRIIGILSQAFINLDENLDDIALLRKKLRKDTLKYVYRKDSIKNKLLFLFFAFMPKMIVSKYCKRKR